MSRCERLHIPVYLDFRCLSPCLDTTTLLSNAGALEPLIRVLRERPGLHRIVVHGFTSRSGPDRTDGDLFNLSQRRADSVRYALVRAGFDPAMIEAAGLGPHPGPAMSEPDLCPPPNEDEGYPQRRVDIGIVVCEEPNER